MKMKRSVCALLLVTLLLPTAASCAREDVGTEGEATETMWDSEGGKGNDAPKPNGSDTSKPNGEEDGGSHDGENKGDSTEEEKTVTVTETYLPEQVRAYYQTAFSAKSSQFTACRAEDAPYAFQDAVTITDCTLKKISIPICRTGAKNAEGKLVFTLYVFDSSLWGLKKAPLRTYPIKIDPERYGLSENDESVWKIIDVDVSGYDIVLTDKETLAMFAATDTVIPAFMMNTDPSNSSFVNGVATSMLDNFPQAQMLYSKVGTESLSLKPYLLLYDFEWERTVTESELAAADAYESMIEMLKKRYSGKYVSILGDSISTFDGISNNVRINASLGDHNVYYKYNTGPYRWEQTYWGRVITETGMKLCVSNAWGSATAYGNGWEDRLYRDSAPYRATRLDRDDGTTPDVIIVYMGTNDLRRGEGHAYGDLYDRIKNVYEDRRGAVVESWFEEVLANSQNGTNVTPGTAYTTFDQAYALSLYLMTQKYPDAEIVCLGLENTNETANFSAQRQAKYNLIIRTLAEYFGGVFVDSCGEYSEINAENVHLYGHDAIALHPNSAGHAAMARMILKTLADVKGSDNNGTDDNDGNESDDTNSMLNGIVGSNGEDGEYSKNY